MQGMASVPPGQAHLQGFASAPAPAPRQRRRSVRRADPAGGGWRVLRFMTARLRGWLRAAALVAVALNLAPLAETLDVAVHAAAGTQGSVEVHGSGGTHSSGEAGICSGDCQSGCEDAGCHGDLHHCGCCVPQPRGAPASGWRLNPPSASGTVQPEQASGPPLWVPQLMKKRPRN